MTTSTETAPAVRSTRLPFVIYLLTAGTFLMGTSEFVVAGLLPQLASDFDTSVAHAGLSITAFAIGMILGAPGMALLTLRLPRRVTLAGALAVFAVGHVIVALTDNFVVLLGARFVTALATGAFWAVSSVVAARLVGPALSSRALGVVLGGGMLANVLGVPLGTFAGQLVGWRGAFWALALLAVVVGVAVARLVPADQPTTAIPSVRAEFRALASGRLWLVLATCALITGSVLTVYSYVAPLLTERAGLPETVVPVALLIFGAGALLGTIICGRLGDTHPYRTLLVTSGVTVVALAGLWAFSALPVSALILFALLGLVGFSSNPILVALAVRFGGEAPTLSAAMPTSIFNLGTAVGTAVAAAALEGFGPLGPVVVGSLVSVFIFLPLGFLAYRETRRGEAHKPMEPAAAS